MTYWFVCMIVPYIAYAPTLISIQLYWRSRYTLK